MPLVIQGVGFDPYGANTVMLTDLTHPDDVVSVAGVAVNSSTQLTVQVAGSFSDGDLLSAIVTTDGVSSVPTLVAVVAPVLTPATTTVPASASLAPLVIEGIGFDPAGTNTVTITDLTHHADSVTIASAVATSTTTLNVTLSGNFTGGDLLSAVVTTDGGQSEPATVAVVAPLVTPASAFVPAKAILAPLVVNGSGFDPGGTNSITLTDQTHPADKVTVGKLTVNSASTLSVTLSGTFTPGDVLTASVVTDKASSKTVPVAVATQPPAITSTNSATFVVGQTGSFTVTTTGFPAPALTASGTLPAGLTWIDNGNGTATLGGMPLPGSARATPYTLTIHANNGAGTAATQTFILSVHQAPAITSANNATFTVGKAGSFAVKVAPGVPAATTFSETGHLPAGITLNRVTGVLGGIPAAGTAGVYVITISASNGLATTQTFTLTVNQTPAITSAASATFTVGKASTFLVTTTGFPSADLSETGTLPAWLTWTDNDNGTATLSGMPSSATPSPYLITIQASNGVGTSATQAFKLLIAPAPPG